MEDVLDVYTRPYDPRFPQVCLDETSRQLLADVTPPLPMVPGHPAKEDYEYERRGVVNLFMICEPLRGWREVMVSDRRTGSTGRSASKTWSTSTILTPRRSSWSRTT